jgi:processive 1,2-diacylglycerol beta-glucosyltransferase
MDHFRELVHPAFDRWSQRVYRQLLYRAPALWGLAYRMSDHVSSSSGLVFGMSSLGTRGLRGVLDRERPDLVVSTHPTPAGALSDLRRQGLTRVPNILVYSDFTAHGQWIHPGVDLYCVPAEAIRADLISRGVPPERVLTTGLPVRAEFDEAVDAKTARRDLDLAPDSPVAVVMAGALGWTGQLAAAARVLRDLRLPLQIVVVAGRDQRLVRRLRETFAADSSRIRALSYTENIRVLMAAADLLVTKAGGVSLAEAIASGLPIVCFGSLAGHEQRNERFVVEAGAALPASSPEKLADAVHRILEEPGTLDRLARGMCALRRPGAAGAVVEALFERFVGAPPLASQA